MSKTKFYRIFIDTDTYTGNFERELTSYVTGRQASTYHGEREARAFQREVKGDPFRHSLHKILLEGFPQVCGITDTPGITTGVCQTVEIYFKRKPSQAQIDLLKSRAQTFASQPGETRVRSVRPPFKITGFRMNKQVIRIEDSDPISI